MSGLGCLLELPLEFELESLLGSLSEYGSQSELVSQLELLSAFVLALPLESR